MIPIFVFLMSVGVTEDTLKPASIHGRWHQVEVRLHVDDSSGVGSEARNAADKSSRTQARVKKQIESGEIGIITQFNRDGTYTHEIIDSDPAMPFPRYRESGQWNLDVSKRILSRIDDHAGTATAETATLIAVERNELVLEIRYRDGQLKGLVETIQLKRFHELESQSDKSHED
ncbi:MAG: hypothetical protein AAGG48_28840 [Planctomycetota bacterium]